MLDRLAAGELPRKHHLALRDAEGRLRYEEALTRAGFEGPYTLLYHLHRPQALRRAELRHGWSAPRPAPSDHLARRHYRTSALSAGGGAAVDVRTPLLFNEDVVVSMVCPDAEDPVYFLNGDGDDLFFIQAGTGLLRSVLGDLRYEPNDYLFVPKGLLHRFVPDQGVPQRWLSLEATGGLKLPEQWRNETGQLRMDAPYCHRDFRRPEFAGPVDEGLREVLVKRGGRFHAFAYEHSPLDVVGFDGTVYPWVFPILNFQPRAGLVHLPPTWHGTFALRGALVCSFVPRIVDFHPEAVPAPYPHSSVDIDELLFYVSGDFLSRRGIGAGSISHHPAGVPHGPHPDAYERSLGAHRTDELAVMLDLARPLVPTAAAQTVEDAGYDESFL